MKILDNIDQQLMIVILILVCSGMVMLYSASSAVANYEFSNDTYFLFKHLARISIGLIFMFSCMFLNYRNYKYAAFYILIFSFILIIIGHFLTPAGQHARWIIIGGRNWLTTSDVARIALIIFTAWYLEKSYRHIHQFKNGLLPFLMAIGIVLAAIAVQPDFSTAATVGLILVVMAFLGGARLKHLLLVFSVLVPLAFVSLRYNESQWIRITSWLNKSENILSSNWQSYQGMAGLGYGGFMGQGLGNSVIKQPGFCPEVQTDFIFSVIGEELGFLGVTLVLILFFWLFHRGIQVARNAPDAFGMYLAFGITLNITVYVLINIGYVIGLLPTTGLPLPFFSYGGSHTLFTLISLGILLNISGQSKLPGFNCGARNYV